MITLEKSEITNNFMDTATLHQMKLSIQIVNGHQLILSYRSMPGNNPSQNANHIHIWQSENYIPWNQPPLGSQPLGLATQSGSVSIQGLNLGKRDYIIGYSVGREVNEIVATAYIPQTVDIHSQTNDFLYFSSKIDVTSVGDTYISFSYETPDGYLPDANHAWVGLWENIQVPIPGVMQLNMDLIPYHAERGDHVLTGLSLAAGQHYCIGLFFGDDKGVAPVSLGASCSFVF